MDKNKKIGYIFLVLTVVFTIIGSTFAWWTWRSTDNTSVTFTVTSGFSCSADGGGNITNNDVFIVPTDECNGEHAIKRTITASAGTSKVPMESLSLLNSSAIINT